MCRKIGEHGLTILPDGASVLTHCNTGALATGGIGTALAPIYLAHEKGRKVHVYVDETRPLLQGSRLTAWELMHAGISCALITDAAAATLMRQAKVDVVLVGADRICANGDFANKIGTYGLAVLARHHGVPFYCAAPWSSVDVTLAEGDLIPIEQRAPAEVTSATRSMRSSAQRRLTAVGRAAPSSDASSFRRDKYSARATVRCSRIPATRPIAAAMPISGAPRTCSCRIASATDSALSRSRVISASGRAR